jgi:hypothetical protein
MEIGGHFPGTTAWLARGNNCGSFAGCAAVFAMSLAMNHCMVGLWQLSPAAVERKNFLGIETAKTCNFFYTFTQLQLYFPSCF